MTLFGTNWIAVNRVCPVRRPVGATTGRPCVEVAPDEVVAVDHAAAVPGVLVPRPCATPITGPARRREWVWVFFSGSSRKTEATLPECVRPARRAGEPLQCLCLHRTALALLDWLLHEGLRLECAIMPYGPVC